MGVDSYPITNKGHDGDTDIDVQKLMPSRPDKTNQYIVVSRNTSDARTLDKLSSKMQSAQQLISTLNFFESISSKTGGVICLNEKFGFFPVILLEDGTPIPLYYFIEVIDELLDYQEIIDEFPNMRYSQVVNTFEFLRKISSINIYNADIDKLEDEIDSTDTSLILTLQKSFADGENKRVLYRDK